MLKIIIALLVDQVLQPVPLLSEINNIINFIFLILILCDV